MYGHTGRESPFFSSEDERNAARDAEARTGKGGALEVQDEGCVGQVPSRDERHRLTGEGGQAVL